MKWCFLDGSPLDYRVGSPAEKPLGGSQSALSYLAATLAALGESVTTVTQTSEAGVYAGVKCLRGSDLPAGFWAAEAFDRIIALNDPEPLLTLRSQTRSPLWFWTQHSHRNPGAELAGEPLASGQLDGVIFVSAWQREQYLQHFGWPAARTAICRNGATPLLQPFGSAQELLRAKAFPLTLIYTSNPFRGLNILLILFPALRLLFPQVQLKIFSSLQVYQAPPEQEAVHERLYQEAQLLEGVVYRPSVSQAELVLELQSAHILAYPNRFLETSCIAVMEALVAGCEVVTSAFGALPETSQGLATLVPYQHDQTAYTLAYFETLKQAVSQWYCEPELQAQQSLRRSQQAAAAYDWRARAQDWLALDF